MIIRKTIRSNEELYGDFELIPLNIDAVEQRIEFFRDKVSKHLGKGNRDSTFLKDYRAWEHWKEMKDKHCLKETEVEYKRPTFKEEYTGEKEDQAFEELENKLNRRNTDRPNVPHYLQGQIEPIDFINSHDMNFNLGNAIKYITRCNHKGTKQEDLRKAIDYLNFELEKQNE